MADLINVTGTYNLDGVNIMPEVEDAIVYDDDQYWSPMATMLTAIQGTEQVDNSQFQWDESTLDQFSVVFATPIASALAGAEQTVTINALVSIGDVLYHSASRQRFQVTSFVSRVTTPGSQATVCKITKIPTTSATTAVSGTPTLRVLSNQIVEGGFYPIAKGIEPKRFYNYTQIMTNTVAITKTMKKTRTYYSSGQWAEDLKAAIKRHNGNHERNIWWGEAMDEIRTITNENGNQWQGRFTQSQGIDSRIVTNRTPYTTLDKATFNEWIRTSVFGSRNSGRREKTLVCGPEAMQALNDIAESPLRTFQGAEQFGLDIKQWKAWGSRTLAIIEEREFMDNSDDAGTIYAIEPENLSICQLGQHYMESYPIELPNQDIEAIVLRTEAGLKMKKENMFAKLSKN